MDFFLPIIKLNTTLTLFHALETFWVENANIVVGSCIAQPVLEDLRCHHHHVYPALSNSNGRQQSSSTFILPQHQWHEICIAIREVASSITLQYMI